MSAHAEALKQRKAIFAVAPMMDWTDRHCRLFHRQLSRTALLYTEMVVADAVIHGDRDRLLGFDGREHPLALQLGGSNPAKLAEAARIGADHGHDEINLNCGCPSDRVQSGTFGACLMKTPDLVAECVAAMKAAVDVPVTVKCRIGVDDQDPALVLPDFIAKIAQAGADAVWIHARKAWLDGLSPKENRDIPPLDYPLVHAVKREFPDLFIGINGGIGDLDQAVEQLIHVDGVMLGRAAYHDPMLLAEVDRRIGEDTRMVDVADVVEAMAAHCDAHVAAGGRAVHVARHMVGLFNGRAGARRWRQALSVEAVKPGADGTVIRVAYRALGEQAA